MTVNAPRAWVPFFPKPEGFIMVYDFQERLNTLGPRFKAINSETLTLVRKAEITTGIKASPVLMEAEEIIPGAAVTRLELQDWFIDVADYKLSGSPVIPLAGDLLRNETTKEEFRLSSMGSDEPPFRYVTSDRLRFHIHTERVKE